MTTLVGNDDNGNPLTVSRKIEGTVVSKSARGSIDIFSTYRSRTLKPRKFPERIVVHLGNVFNHAVHAVQN